MSRHAMIKRAKIARSKRLGRMWKKLSEREIIADIVHLLQTVHARTYEIEVQEISQLTDLQRRERYAPTITITSKPERLKP